MSKLRVRASKGSSGGEDIAQAINALKAIRNPLMRYWVVQLIDLIAQTCVNPTADDKLQMDMMRAAAPKKP